jgi:hypothetical protein
MTKNVKKKALKARKYPEYLTLENLRPSESDRLSLKSLSKKQRLALYNLTSIFYLTFYDKEMRGAAQELQKMIMANTLDRNTNECSFDLSDEEKKRLQNPVVPPSVNANS